jgi:hypothetical protein
MIAYCKEDHMKIDYLNHKALCLAIQLIAKRRGELNLKHKFKNKIIEILL